MSKIIQLMKDFLDGAVGVEEFLDHYPALWRLMRDSGEMGHQNLYAQRGLNVVFTAVDCFDDGDPDQHVDQRVQLLTAEVRAVFSVLWVP